MELNRRKLLGTGVGVSATALTAACGGGSTSSQGNGSSAAPTSTASNTPNLRNEQSINPSAPATGDINPNGVLNIVQTSAFEHLDPQNIYVTNSTEIARLMFRQLMAWKEDPQAGTFTLTYDLAAAMPVASKNNTVWTFKIRPGLKYEDGTPITAADIKYGVERSMDPNIPYGPVYAKTYLLGGSTYTGPSKGDLKSIVVPDDETIIFNLNQPLGTWAELCTLNTFTPVPKAKDTGKNYDLHPVCLGPYKIQSYSHDTKLVLVRNTYWDPKTDPLRSQHFATVNCVMNVNESAVDNDLFSDTNGGTNAMFSDFPIPGDIPRASQPQYGSRTLKAPTAGVDYYGVQQNQPAMKDARVRQAILYARDPGATIKAIGGPLLGYPIQCMSPAVLKGFDPTPSYYPDLGTDGNPEKAKALLKAAGVKNLKITIAYAATGATAAAVEQVEVQAMARAGITVITKPLNPDNYYTVTGTLSQKFDLVHTGWYYDIPDASTIYPPLFQGGSNIFNGTSNAGRVNVKSLDAMMAKALRLEPAAALPIWQAIDKYLISNALVIPRYGINDIQLVGTKVKGAYVSPTLGTMDVTNAYISTS